jgi:soluble lytic murein transglycosylase-like protein
MVKLKFITILMLMCIGAIFLTSASKPRVDRYHSTRINKNIVNSAPSIQMYFYIKKYAKKFSVPEAYAFSLAYQETKYRGPLDLNYNHRQISPAGALGPMQITTATAKLIYGTPVSKTKLISDINLNVMISMKLLHNLYSKYNNWGLAFGAYNTGKPCINGYARNILSHQYVWDELTEI